MNYLKENLIGKELRSISYENGGIFIIPDKDSTITVNTKITCSIMTYMQSISIIDVTMDSDTVALIFSDGSEIWISRVIERGISPESFVYHGENNIIIVDNSIE
ncbi:hypothetical protein NKI09_08195 [Mesorhizobium sp. M0757]|uniref:hypothetical protein n=1 Tax=unclassified Mesorhizobium TaxID=325217 RepID=UPI0003CDD686|nr:MULTISPECIES: hypothetical protein [unclassified Mesorhizobium]ESX29944.1 hypothetical protein X765_12745 [Mesorhizobium sp. LSHC440B00]